jgi:hypothetical protein
MNPVHNTRLQFYKTISLLRLEQCDKNRLRAAEMKYLRRTAGYTLLYHKRNEEISELRLSPGTEKAGEDLLTTSVSNGTTDIIIIIIIITIMLDLNL